MTQPVRLVVVHGIGSQKVGDTAKRWAETLVKFAEETGHTAVVHEVELVTGPATVRVTLTPPANAVNDGAPPTSEFTIVEAHWADAFAQPTLGRVLRFLLTVAPALAITQAILIGRHKPRKMHAWISVLRASTALLPAGLGIVALALAAPLIAVLLLVLLVAASIPIPAVKQWVGRALGWLSTTIGDAYTFVADPVSRVAMETRLSARLVPPNPDGTTAAPSHAADVGATVVLAHSQGAAVAYRALKRLPINQRPRVLITVGSGLGRLNDVSLLRHLPWYLTPIFIGIVATSAAGLALWRLPESLVLLAAAALGLAVAVWRCARRLDEVESEEAPLAPLEGVSWLDIWAPFDLVPNGYAVTSDRAAEGTAYEHHLVAGELSVFRDHVRYDRDWGQTIPLVFSRLLAPESGRPVGYVGVRPESKTAGPFARRDIVGLLLRSVPMVVVIGASLFLDLMSIGLWVRTAPPDAFTGIVGFVLTPLTMASDVLAHYSVRQPAPETLLGALTLGVIGFLGSIAVRRGLTFFQDRETRRWLKLGYLRNRGDEGTGRWGRGRWLAALTIVGLIAMVVPGLLVWQHAGPPWSPEQAVEAYLSAVADNDMERLCAITHGTIAGLGRTDSACAEPGQPALRRLCGDARSAIGDLPDNAVRVTGTEVEVTWAPEERPYCGSRESGEALLPAELVKTENRWKVSAVA
jgi:hypothetical protein